MADESETERTARLADDPGFLNSLFHSFDEGLSSSTIVAEALAEEERYPSAKVSDDGLITLKMETGKRKNAQVQHEWRKRKKEETRAQNEKIEKVEKANRRDAIWRRGADEIIAVYMYLEKRRIIGHITPLQEEVFELTNGDSC